ncbi:MAG: ComF family protein [Actinomycetota bacterium]
MSLLDFALMASPHRCAGCGVASQRLCPGCARALGSPSVPRVPGAERVLVAFAYEGAARSLVLDLKLRGDRGAVQPLVTGLVRAVATTGLSADVLTWVPGRPRENRRRGLDHAGILATQLGRALGLPAVPLLRRSAERPDQTSLGAAERWANLQGAFTARSCRGAVGLVDDLVTTGATAATCAGALRGAGAAGIEVLAACSA